MKILIVGYGSIGKRHLKNLIKNTSFQFVVFSKQKNDQFLKKNKINVYNSIEECLEEKPEIAFITNITSLHIPLALGK